MKKSSLFLLFFILCGCTNHKKTDSSASTIDSTSIISSDILSNNSNIDSLSSIISSESTISSLIDDSSVSTSINEDISSSQEITNQYYKNISFSANGDTLENSLYNLIKSYDMPYTYDNCDAYIANANEDPSNPNNVILFYTGRSVPKNYMGATSSAPDGWNKEHVWAKSHGNFASNVAGRDIHHLMPTDNGVNNTRSSKDFDEGGSAVVSYKSYGQTITVQYADNNDRCYTTSNTFEPRDVVKGDVARILFYMAVRYEGKSDGGPDLELVDSITGNSSTSPTLGKMSTLLRWHIEDPVDAFEMKRNEYIFNLQGNRNPFIDYPEFAAKIWQA